MKRLFLTLISVTCAGMAAAHSPYLLPNKFDLNKRDHVSVQASFTENYFIPDVVMKADDYHVVSPDGTRIAIAPIYTKDLAVLDVATAQDGTYRISTGNRAGRTGKAVLQADGKWQFFDEREGAPVGGKVHEIRSITRADVYVSRGTPNDNALAITHKGLEFEFLTHPNHLLAGAPAKLRVLYDGKPLSDQVITLQKAALEEGASTSPVEVRSATDGSVSLPFTAPGIYHLMARHRFALPASDGKAESHTYAVTLEVTE